MEQNNVRQPGESVQAFRGRQRRERNAAVAALGLKSGDPIMYGGKPRRYSISMSKTDPRYQHIRRLTADETAALEADEQRKMDETAAREQRGAERVAFEARPEVAAVRAICYRLEALEMSEPEILNRLTVDEWVALAAKLTGAR